MKYMKSKQSKGKKAQVLEEVFKACKKRNSFVFDNDQLEKISTKRGFKNKFDVTKLDNTNKLPQLLKDKNYFVVHLGKGKHQFIKGIKYGYHTFEDIKKKQKRTYRPSILNDLNTSESNVLSVVFNQGIIHDFFKIQQTPKIYLPHRTNDSFEYAINNQKVTSDNQQIEIDMTIESNGSVFTFEAKNNFPQDFNVSQLYLPFLCYHEKKKQGLAIKKLYPCYLLRKKNKNGDSVVRLYKYSFTDPYEMSSITLLDSVEYQIIKSS